MSPLPAPGAVVFDLDGTLVDTRRDLATAVNRTRSDHALPPLALERVVAMIGEGSRRLVERSLADAAGGRGLAGEALAVAHHAFLAHYRRVWLATTRPYPGIPGLVSGLAGRLPLAVLTNKPEAASRRILAGVGLAPYIAELVGGDTLAVRKPEPAGIHHLAARFGLAPARLLLVGDSAIDAATAEAAGCPFAFVEWGFASVAERSAISAGWRFGSAAELAAALGAAAR